MTRVLNGGTHMPADGRAVLDASAVLEISEHRLFELAYRRWYGHEAGRRVVDRAFGQYLFRMDAPFWVRQYCRDVLRCSRAGDLSPREFGVEPLPEGPLGERIARLGLAVAFLVSVLGLLMFLMAGFQGPLP